MDDGYDVLIVVPVVPFEAYVPVVMYFGMPSTEEIVMVPDAVAAACVAAIDNPLATPAHDRHTVPLAVPVVPEAVPNVLVWSTL